MQNYIFTDLDDTLFSVREKLEEMAIESLTPATIGVDGGFSSFSTTAQFAVLQWLEQLGELIPVTGRSSTSFKRVIHSFNGVSILDFGAVITDYNGELDLEWDEVIRSKATLSYQKLKSIESKWAQINDAKGLGLRIRIIEDFGMPIYVVAKDPKGDEKKLSDLADLCDWQIPGFTLHQNGNNLSAMPIFVNKYDAVRFVTGKYCRADKGITIGVGDSLSDIGFMGACDFCLAPSDSQIWQSLIT